MESLFIAFILIMIITFTIHPPNTVSFLLTHLWSTTPSPGGCGSLFFLGGVRAGERCIDVTGCTSEEEEE